MAVSHDRLPAKGVECTIDGCGKPCKSKRLCAAHYSRLLKWGSPRPDKPVRARRRPDEPCVVADCTRQRKSHGLCATHYARLRAHGDVRASVPIRRNSGGWTMRDGYIALTVEGGKRALEHRLVMERIIGRPLLATEEVHHINGVRHDNRVENLELWSRSHPSGQRVADKVKWAKELLATYEPEALACA